jgi:preprotein translocase subunit SecA
MVPITNLVLTTLEIMAHSPADLVQRKHNFAIVDEVDSVLIDDASH